MSYQNLSDEVVAKGIVRTLSQHEELPLLRGHLLRLDRESRHDRFQGFLDDHFIECYAAKCASDGTAIVAYFEDGVVRGAAELHPPDESLGSEPEAAFSVETAVRRRGVGARLFRELIAEARRRGYRSLRITTGVHNDAMRALARKFGAHLTFHHGESTGTINLAEEPRAKSVGPSYNAAFASAARAMMDLNRAYWDALFRAYGRFGHMAAGWIAC
jgi:GNAT superfamily N-acetyltransferase